MKVSEGFQAADDRNLPKMDYLMMLEFMQENECYNAAETRGAKALLASREAYVDSAVGYVEVKREGDLCTLKCRVTPEHKVRTKLYQVRAVIDEHVQKIVSVECSDCAASAGGCKHAICFAMWLIKRSDEPSVTSVACYWKKPKLAGSVTEDKFVLAKDLSKRKRRNHENVAMGANLDDFIAECKKRNMNNNNCGSLILLYKDPQQSSKDYSVFNLLLEYVQSAADSGDYTYEDFISFSKNILTHDVIDWIKETTKEQANSKLWHSMRKGRLTGSKIYDAAHCRTDDGALVQTILGGYKVPETKAIRRGKRLEKVVMKQLEEELHESIRDTGFILITPIIGASPDGLCKNLVIEVKCPMYVRTLKNYIKNDTLTAKFKAQIMLQMHAAKKPKGLFCVADPSYEKSKLLHKFWINYDENYIHHIIAQAEKFWIRYIFPKILDSVK